MRLLETDPLDLLLSSGGYGLSRFCVNKSTPGGEGCRQLSPPPSKKCNIEISSISVPLVIGRQQSGQAYAQVCGDACFGGVLHHFKVNKTRHGYVCGEAFSTMG